MKKIVMITPFPSSDNIHAKNTGVGAYSFYLNQALSEQKDIFLEVWSHLEKNNKEISVKDNLKIKRVWSRDLKGLFILIIKLIKERAQVVHIQHEFNIFGGPISSVLSPFLFLFARIFSKKLVTTMHGGFGLAQVDKNFVKENGYDKIPPFLIKLVFLYVFGAIAHLSNEIIVHEDWQKEELVREYKINKNKIKVIPIGVEEDSKIITSARRVLNIKKDVTVFLYMGFAARYKGLEEMLPFYREYIKENPKTLLILGAGPAPRLEGDRVYMSWYNKIKNQYLKLGENVVWAGFIEGKDIGAYYSAADATVFPYSRRIAASGPMALSIGYEKDMILSNVLQNVTFDKNLKYNIDFKDRIKTKEIKKERLWSKVAEKTLGVYKKD